MLAGGESRRLGRPKAFLTVGGRELLEHAIDATAPLPLTISTRDEAAIRDALGRYGWEPRGREFVRAGRRCVVVTDPDPGFGGLGPLAGIIAGLADSTLPSWVLACDMPFAMPALGRALLSLLERSPDALAAVPFFRDRLHGACAAYRPAAIEPARQRLKRGDLSLEGFISSISHVRLQGDELADLGVPERLLFNVNRPDQLERARRVVQGRD